MKNINLSFNNNDLGSKILNDISEIFMRDGFHNISMDEVANLLHVSKKTIYKHFYSKEMFITKIMVENLSSAYQVIVSVIQAKSNIIEKFLKLSEMVEKRFPLFNETSLNNLNYHFPQLANDIKNYKNKRIIPLIKILLRIGKKKKLIIDIPDDIVLKIFTSALSSIIQPEFIDSINYSYHETFGYTFNMLLNGVLTKKGKQILINKIEASK